MTCTRASLILVAILTSACATGWAQPVEVPKVTGNWWKISDSNIDLGEWTSDTQDACDFTIFQADDGTWQLIACMRYTNYPGGTRLFHRWESQNLTDTMWEPKGTFLTTDMSIHTKEGTLQAPHSFVENGTHYLFYNNAGAYAMTSPDGKNWSHATDYQGSYKFFDMGRDVMIFDDRDGVTGDWIAYYTDNGVEARRADDLMGPWSSKWQVTSAGNPESPFVLKHGDAYYRWGQSQVYRSTDPTSFPSDPVVNSMWWWKYAPEIVEHNGQQYVAAYSHGQIFVAPMVWTTTDDPDIDARVLDVNIPEGEVDQPWDPETRRYTMTVPYEVDQLHISPVLSNAGASYRTGVKRPDGSYSGACKLQVGVNEARLWVTAPNGHANERYYIDVTRMEIPEPATLSLLALGGLLIVKKR